MSKLVFGHCPLCPPKAPTRKLFGGVCGYHLNHPEDDQSGTKPKKEERPVDDKKALSRFFQEQSKLVPRNCENCKGHIITTAEWTKSAAVAHIIPKRHFKSVQTNPLNVWFGCIICHTNYDNSWSKAMEMPVWGLCVDRFKQFMHLIADTELRYLPDPLRVLTGR